MSLFLALPAVVYFPGTLISTEPIDQNFIIFTLFFI